mmetsp:Transcript_14011/g.30506  ORF Transcript_14011/g.30506 Transcript_14011/m.30506 type:complete len:81 (+) Transcript_14011:1530-1772(+)
MPGGMCSDGMDRAAILLIVALKLLPEMLRRKHAPIVGRMEKARASRKRDGCVLLNPKRKAPIMDMVLVNGFMDSGRYELM